MEAHVTNAIKENNKEVIRDHMEACGDRILGLCPNTCFILEKLGWSNDLVMIHYQTLYQLYANT